MSDQLVCATCHAAYPLYKPRWRCACGGLLDLQFTPRFDLGAIASRPPTLWRYREALPLPAEARPVTLGEGFTPIIEITIAGRTVHVKQEQLAPSGSYKDRGATLLISAARAMGVADVVEDSSGNAGAAIAAYAAAAAINCEIFVPANTSPEKVAQVRAYGAAINLVPGSRQDTARAVWEAAQTRYYASHVWNPLFFQGTKTFAYEVCEQLGWRGPDAVLLPVGNGTLLLGAYLGFRDLLGAGLIDHLPRLFAVQAQRCAPLAQAARLNADQPAAIVSQPTWAEGIAIATPIRGDQCLRAVRDSGGAWLMVSEDQIAQAWSELAGRGYYVEPTSAATIAALPHLPSDAGTCVTALTGHGLKSTAKNITMLKEPI